MSKKTALITGIRGQDGAYLTELLLSKGYRVIGTDRRRVDTNNWRMNSLGIKDDDLEYIYMDLLDIGNINRIIQKYQPDELYNLAAQSFVGVSFEQPMLTTDVDALGVLRILDAIRTFSPHTKFYQASTSEMFGKVLETPQSEKTPLNPRSPYGVAKVYGHFITKNYRDSYDMFTASGILFNHESPLRGTEFVTRKITLAVSNMHHGLQEKLVLGNMDAQRDWGFAKEYVEGMWRMLQAEKGDDYVLATGETSTVRKFVEASFAKVGQQIEWEGEGAEERGIDKSTGKTIVEISPDFYRPAEVELLLGDATKAKEKLGWEATTKFEKLVDLMMDADLKLVEKTV